MNRRDFLAAGLANGVAVAAGLSTPAAENNRSTWKPGRFQLSYAPHFGMFKNLAGSDPVDQVKFMADQGFTALEDRDIKRKPRGTQERIRREMDRHGMTMGVFVATADFGNPNFTSGRRDLQIQVLNDLKDSREVAKRMNAKWMTVVPGKVDRRLSTAYQTSNAIDLLKRCAEICEPFGLVMVLESLNHWSNRPQLFLNRISQASRICRTVDSPSCKILFDIYQQQTTEGRLIPLIDKAWNEIAYFQIGDNPGRKEPGTGGINFRDIFGRIQQRGYGGILGMEHGNSMPGEEGEQAVIDAYVAHDCC
jgi:hydroxypyruvate isomerase